MGSGRCSGGCITPFCLSIIGGDEGLIEYFNDKLRHSSSSIQEKVRSNLFQWVFRAIRSQSLPMVKRFFSRYKEYGGDINAVQRDDSDKYGPKTLIEEAFSFAVCSTWGTSRDQEEIEAELLIVKYFLAQDDINVDFHSRQQKPFIVDSFESLKLIKSEASSQFVDVWKLIMLKSRTPYQYEKELMDTDTWRFYEDVAAFHFLMEHFGMNLQHVRVQENGEELKMLQEAQASQYLLKDKGSSDKDGRGLLHVCAVSDRADVLEWLLKKNNILHRIFQDRDRQNHSVLETAQAAGSTAVVNEIAKVRPLYDDQMKAATVIQATWKGFSVRSEYSTQLHQIHCFFETWGAVVNLLPHVKSQTWESIQRERCDLAEDAEEFADIESERQDLLGNAIAISATSLRETDKFISDEEEWSDDDDEQLEEQHPSPNFASSSVSGNELLDEINIAHAAYQWYVSTADSTSARCFLKRLHQLANGEGGRKLVKPLVGFTVPIFESYLNHGQRILWTKCREKMETGDTRRSILVWYVSKHDRVSHYAKQIDRADARLERQRGSSIPLAHLGGIKDETLILSSASPLVDPMKNTPLKIRVINREDLFRLDNPNWQPPLRLTEEERTIVDKPGTVLCLGRSGTGKTLCICSRMAKDRCTAVISPFRQLFVARSRRICLLVKGFQSHQPLESDCTVEYFTFRELLEYCVRNIPCFHGPFQKFQQSKRITFLEFKQDIFDTVRKKLHPKLAPLVVWTQIRSFIKGSIEAIMAGGFLTKEQYLSLGSDRCRLNESQREEAYSVFQAYSKICLSKGWWDDCDRVLDIFRKGFDLKTHSFHQQHDAHQDRDREESQQARFHYVYVDEVQDFTQAELALLFLLSKSQSLFLAGDTAQNVEEGVDFRFEDVRSMVYLLTDRNSKLCPKKERLCLNFRSHTGVLNVAAVVLELLFEAFPNSTDKAQDRGLFVGPRPAILSQDISTSKVNLRSLMERNEKLVVLTHPSEVKRIQQLSGSEDHLILSIHEAKGLEFQYLAVVDFFCSLPRDQQKNWRKLIQTAGKGLLFRYEFPELETQLKLLYTALTRSVDRLMFVETSPSSAGSTFWRWLLDRSLAENFSESDVIFMTKDEWRFRGIELAIQAESCAANLSYSAAKQWWDRSLACFRKAEDDELTALAQIQSQSWQFLYQSENNFDESSAVSIVHSCLTHGLLFEALHVSCKLLPLLSQWKQDYFQKLIIKTIEEKNERIGALGRFSAFCRFFFPEVRPTIGKSEHEGRN